MRIQHNINALNSHRNLGVNTGKSSKNLEKLSSGFRINRAGDDAAGLAISEKMRAQINGLSQAQQNAQDGISLIQTAEGALNETHSILQRMRKLSVQSSNGTYTNEDRTKLQEEATALTTEIDRISASTKFNGMTLANGTGAKDSVKSFTFQIGTENAADQRITVSISSMDADTLGVSGISIANEADSNTAIATVDTAIETVSTQRSALGAAQNRLEHTVSNLSVTEENLTASESRIRDVDMAKEMMDFTKNNILTQAAQAMLAQANMQPQGVLQLLQ
ncbi:flagellin [Sedimentibacter sp. zth1]|uniref:flagellin N-terminal helical domain-containing protein n=1 Tax=Sedimentibacter sp. zth1 TaxID=2816908 RepID=UPI001A930077|nr:flagellin [Sedimentibacter sp. zth1]QSX07164.1 flagellin [Sedimentibacter sp. zth1]